MAALSPARAPAERQDIIARYYGDYETGVRESPIGYGIDGVHVYLPSAQTGV